MSNFYLIAASSLIFFSIYLKREFIVKKTGLVDVPDKKLKEHKKNTPVIGGVVFGLVTILILITSIYTNYTIIAGIVIAIGLYIKYLKKKNIF